MKVEERAEDDDGDDLVVENKKTKRYAHDHAEEQRGEGTKIRTTATTTLVTTSHAIHEKGRPQDRRRDSPSRSHDEKGKKESNDQNNSVFYCVSCKDGSRKKKPRFNVADKVRFSQQENAIKENKRSKSSRKQKPKKQKRRRYSN
jgi:hypothetical protein